MRNKTKEGNTINTPMRKLIKKLPGEWCALSLFHMVKYKLLDELGVESVVFH